MQTTIMALSIDPRIEHAPEVQNILTKYGSIIKTRLGLHETNKEPCENRGLILLHINGKEHEILELTKNLEEIEGVKAKSMTL